MFTKEEAQLLLGVLLKSEVKTDIETILKGAHIPNAATAAQKLQEIINNTSMNEEEVKTEEAPVEVAIPEEVPTEAAAE